MLCDSMDQRLPTHLLRRWLVDVMLSKSSVWCRLVEKRGRRYHASITEQPSCPVAHKDMVGRKMTY